MKADTQLNIAVSNDIEEERKSGVTVIKCFFGRLQLKCKIEEYATAKLLLEAFICKGGLEF